MSQLFELIQQHTMNKSTRKIVNWYEVLIDVYAGTVPTSLDDPTPQPIVDLSLRRYPLNYLIREVAYHPYGQVVTGADLNDISGEWAYIDTQNTANYVDFLEREVQFSIFENIETDEAVVVFNIHIGHDIRSGYSRGFAFRFATQEDFIRVFNALHNIDKGTCIIDGQVEEFGIGASALAREYYFGFNHGETTFLCDIENTDDLTEEIGQHFSISDICFAM